MGQTSALAIVWLANANGSRAVEVGIWVGLGMLSLTLLVLTLTRWGNVKTTHKCVALSVFAHLLLVAYAYQARLFLAGNGSSGSERIVPIHLVSEADEWLDELPPDEIATPDEFDPVVRNETAIPEPVAPDLLDPSPEGESLAAGEIAVVIPLSVTAPALLDNASEPPQELAALDDPTNELDSTDKSEDVETPPEQQESQSADHSLAENQPDSVQLQPPVESVLNEAITPSDPERNAIEVSSSEAAPTFRPLITVEAQPAPTLYSLRNPEQRRANAMKRGGTEGTEQAVESALKWLATHQQTDGRWNPRLTEAGREFRVLGHDRQGAGADADTAITGLAVLAFMGAGHDHLHGEYRDNVRNGLEFILKSQAGSGHLAGEASLFAHMYSHGIATLAVSEAYALTGDQRLKHYVERAVAYSVAAQDPRGGGWRYQPGEPGDMSQFGWQVMALKSAQLGGTNLPASTVQRMKTFLDSCTSGQYSGLASYRPGQQPSATMTAEALACRYFLGQSVSERTGDEAAEFILRQPPGTGEVDFYLWYYATFALYQVGGDSWESWNRQLQKELTSSQVQGGHHAGSWEPNGKWSGYGGRVFSTALATMCLEVYYRYLPMMREQVARR